MVVQLTKASAAAGVSEFKGQNGDVRRFTHDESNPPLSFTCETQALPFACGFTVFLSLSFACFFIAKLR